VDVSPAREFMVTLEGYYGFDINTVLPGSLIKHTYDETGSTAREWP